MTWFFCMLYQCQPNKQTKKVEITSPSKYSVSLKMSDYNLTLTPWRLSAPMNDFICPHPDISDCGSEKKTDRAHKYKLRMLVNPTNSMPISYLDKVFFFFILSKREEFFFLCPTKRSIQREKVIQFVFNFQIVQTKCQNDEPSCTNRVSKLWWALWGLVFTVKSRFFMKEMEKEIGKRDNNKKWERELKIDVGQQKKGELIYLLLWPNTFLPCIVPYVFVWSVKIRKSQNMIPVNNKLVTTRGKYFQPIFSCCVCY